MKKLLLILSLLLSATLAHAASTTANNVQLTQRNAAGDRWVVKYLPAVGQIETMADLAGELGVAVGAGDITSVTAGAGLFGGGTTGAVTLIFNPTTVEGSQVWGNGTTDTIVWEWNRLTGIDPAMQITSNGFIFSGFVTTGTFLGSGAELTVDSLAFNGNLATSDDTLQEIANKFDDFSAGVASGDPILVGGVAVTDGSGVDFIGGTNGVDIAFVAGASPDTATFDFDTTEVAGSKTWGDGSTDTIVYTFNRATGTDPTMTIGNNIVTFADTLAAATLTGAGGGITLDASGFNGNLLTTDNTVQEVAQKFDDFASGGGGDLTAVTAGTGITVASSSGPIPTVSLAAIADLRLMGNVSGGSAAPVELTGAQALAAQGITSSVAEVNFTDGVTSAIQTQLNLKAPSASPTFTGTVTVPTPFTLGAVSVLPTGTELNFVDGVTSAIQTQLDGKASLTGSPTFGAGAPFTWTFNGGATDPNIDFDSAIIRLENGLVRVGDAGTATVAGDGNLYVEADLEVDGSASVAGGITAAGALTSTGGTITMAEIAAPATPAAANVVIYAKADGLLYSKDDAGVETSVSGVPTTITVSDSTDATSSVAMFDSATGDLAPRTDGNFIYNSTTGVASVVGFGIGNVTVTPFSALHVSATGAGIPRGITNTQHSTDTNPSRLNLYKSRGGLATPSTVATADNLALIRFGGYDSANYIETAGIAVGVEGTVATTRVPSFMTFSTGTDAAPTVLTERLRIDSAGLITATGPGFVGSYDTTATGSDFRSVGHIVATLADYNDNTGAVAGATAGIIEHRRVSFSPTADQLGNWASWFFTVPFDYDSAVTMRARLRIRLSGADTGTQRWVMSFVQIADSAGLGTALTTPINLDFAGDAAGASSDAETIGWVTLTGWTWTAGSLVHVRLARDGDAAEDASTVASLLLERDIEYGVLR